MQPSAASGWSGWKPETRRRHPSTWCCASSTPWPWTSRSQARTAKGDHARSVRELAIRTLAARLSDHEGARTAAALEIVERFT